MMHLTAFALVCAIAVPCLAQQGSIVSNGQFYTYNTESERQIIEGLLRQRQAIDALRQAADSNNFYYRNPTPEEIAAKEEAWKAANPFISSMRMPNFSRQQIRVEKRNEYELRMAELEMRLQELEAQREKTPQRRPPSPAPQEKRSPANQTESAYDAAFSASEAKAIALYPFAADAHSVGWKRMAEIDNELRLKNDPLYFSPDKPFIIAERVAQEIRNKSKYGFNGAQGGKSGIFARLSKAAANGDAESQFYLGQIYDIGDGVERNLGEAAKWYRKAADQGNAMAQSNLGTMYQYGEGVTKDATEAGNWYRKAAMQGNAVAQFNLGGMYAEGEGVAKNPTQAVKWLRAAADQGNASAQLNLGSMYFAGDGIERNYAEAIKWYRKAAEQGHPKAQFCMASMYAEGTGVPKDEIEALAWFNISAASGDVDAIAYRDKAEAALGRENTLASQKRSREIGTEIEAKKVVAVK